MSATTPCSTGRRAAAVALAVVLAALTGCSGLAVGVARPGAAAATSTGATPSGPTAPATPAVPPAVVSMDPPVGATGVLPSSPIIVNAGAGTLRTVVVMNPDGAALAGERSADRRSWRSTEPMGYGTAYAVTAVAVNAAGAPTRLAGTVATVTPRTLTYPSVWPDDRHPVVGVGQPVAITFDEDVTDRAAVEKRLTVTATPPVAGRWSWYSDREVHYRPEAFWPTGTHVAVDVDIFGVDVGAGIFGQQDRHVEFDIGPKIVAVADSTELELRVYENDQLVKTMPTSMGKPGFETYSGTYVVTDQSRTYTMDSSTYGLPIDDPNGYVTDVEFASRISSSGIFVHAAPWSVADQGVRNVSHGCLNVSPADAEWFYDNVGRGDVVEVTGTGVPLQAWDGFGDWNMPWDQWVAGSALP